MKAHTFVQTPSTQRFLTMVLQQMLGFDVVESRSFYDTLPLLSETEFGIVILEIAVGNGKIEQQHQQQLEQLELWCSQDMPLILISKPHVQSRCKVAGYVALPLQPSELISVINCHLRNLSVSI